MTTSLTVISNNKKHTNIQLNQLESLLNHSKKDIDSYFFILADIASYHSIQSVKIQAWKHLVKQDKLQHILQDLITRIQFLKTQPSTETTSNRWSYPKIVQEIAQIEIEIEIFKEIHYRVKRRYIFFADKYLLNKPQALLKVA